MIEPQSNSVGLTPPLAGSTTTKKLPAEIKKASLAVQLNHFMQAPEDPELEQRFGTMLLNAQFEALVAVKKRGAVTQTDVHSELLLSLGITTYLADGNKYIPVFTDPQVCQRFMASVAPDVQMRTFSFTTKELMGEVGRLGIAGLLINPGKQSFPLTLAYWQYASQVFAAIDADAKTRISLLDDQQLQRAHDLIKRAKHIRGIEKLWVAQAIEGEHDPALVVIAKFKGSAGKFQHRIAADLARNCQALLNADQDVLVGTTEDDLGKKVAHECAPVYVVNHLFGGRPAYD